jgi:hypothetical protein
MRIEVLLAVRGVADNAQRLLLHLFFCELRVSILVVQTILVEVLAAATEGADDAGIFLVIVVVRQLEVDIRVTTGLGYIALSWGCLEVLLVLEAEMAYFLAAGGARGLLGGRKVIEFPVGSFFGVGVSGLMLDLTVGVVVTTNLEMWSVVGVGVSSLMLDLTVRVVVSTNLEMWSVVGVGVSSLMLDLTVRVVVSTDLEVWSVVGVGVSMLMLDLTVGVVVSTNLEVAVLSRSGLVEATILIDGAGDALFFLVVVHLRDSALGLGRRVRNIVILHKQLAEVSLRRARSR